MKLNNTIEAEDLTTLDALVAIHNAAEVAYGDRLGTYPGAIAEQLERETARLGVRLLDPELPDEQFDEVVNCLVCEVGEDNVDDILQAAYAAVNGGVLTDPLDFLKMSKDLKDVVLDTSLPITAGVKLLSELTGTNWTEERHLAAVATLAKIQANAAALQRILDTYQPAVAKLAKAHGLDTEGVATLKVPQVNGEAREVAVKVHVGEESTTKQTLDADAIRGVLTDPLDFLYN